ncbi:MAG: peroxiredoxin [Acidobacteria bacterium]|nr:peroxiredoxin [Acidobacteriota bacterium]
MMPTLNIGDLAPDFSLLNHRGEEVRLSDYRGRRVLLWFFPQADTPGCRQEAIGFRDRMPHFWKADVVLLGVSFDDPERNRLFAERYGFPFDLLCDTRRRVALAYGACDAAEDRAPRRMSYVIGVDGRIEQAYPRVNPKNHPEDMLALLADRQS